MSAEAIAAVLHHSEARGTDKLVLIGIAWHTNDNPEFGCFPSQETLAAYSNVSVRQVRRALELILGVVGEDELASLSQATCDGNAHAAGSGDDHDLTGLASDRHCILLDSYGDPRTTERTSRHRTAGSLR